MFIRTFRLRLSPKQEHPKNMALLGHHVAQYFLRLYSSIPPLNMKKNVKIVVGSFLSRKNVYIQGIA